MKVYKCSVCDYIYDPEADRDEYNEKNFSSLPQDWRCPGCGSHKSCFVQIDIDEKNDNK